MSFRRWIRSLVMRAAVDCTRLPAPRKPSMSAFSASTILRKLISQDPCWRNGWGVFEEDPAYREFVLRVSLGRRNSPESIADTFIFLCSPLAAEINGQILSPDYGAGIGNRL